MILPGLPVPLLLPCLTISSFTMSITYTQDIEHSFTNKLFFAYSYTPSSAITKSRGWLFWTETNVHFWQSQNFLLIPHLESWDILCCCLWHNIRVSSKICHRPEWKKKVISIVYKISSRSSKKPGILSKSIVLLLHNTVGNQEACSGAELSYFLKWTPQHLLKF